MEYVSRRRHYHQASLQIKPRDIQTNWWYIAIAVVCAGLAAGVLLNYAHQINQLYDQVAQRERENSKQVVQYVSVTKGQPAIALLKENPFRPGSVWVYVSAHHPLPQNFTPQQLVTLSIPTASDLQMQMMPAAASALARMAAAAQRDEVPLIAVSAYRSNADQQALYDQETARYGASYVASHVAQPGESEHATGLAVDINTDSTACRHNISLCAIDQATGGWLAQNASKYGFILRYPPGKAAATGIASEPWHLRYIGPSARALTSSGLTLDEFVARVEPSLRR